MTMKPSVESKIRGGRAALREAIARSWAAQMAEEGVTFGSEEEAMNELTDALRRTEAMIGEIADDPEIREILPVRRRP